jgi:hypothetical protein
VGKYQYDVDGLRSQAVAVARRTFDAGVWRRGPLFSSFQSANGSFESTFYNISGQPGD